MLKVVKIYNTSFDALRRLIPKFLVMGKSDVRTAVEAGPYGTDSNPVKDMIALYGQSETTGKQYIIGYLNKNRLAAGGEHRIFATDANGAFKFNVWLRADGTILIGDSDDPTSYTNFVVKYNELKTEYDKTKLYLTTLKTATLAVATALDALVPGTSTAFNTAMAGQVVGDISSSKNPKIKTP